MNNTIQIVEKPDWISWEDIKQCLYEAHAVNREKGIYMNHYLWPINKIRNSLGEKGVMFVALNGEKIVGTAAIGDRVGSKWYNKGRYAYICFDGVITDYNGKGIFSQLDSKREEVARKHGYNVLVLDTHAHNIHRQKIALKNGYRYVRYFQANSRDHYSVAMAKWINGCPYSSLYCRTRYHVSKLKTIVSCFLNR